MMMGKMTKLMKLIHRSEIASITAQKMKFSIKDSFSKCDQIRRKLYFILVNPRNTVMIKKHSLKKLLTLFAS